MAAMRTEPKSAVIAAAKMVSIVATSSGAFRAHWVRVALILIKFDVYCKASELLGLPQCDVRSVRVALTWFHTVFVYILETSSIITFIYMYCVVYI